MPAHPAILYSGSYMSTRNARQFTKWPLVALVRTCVARRQRGAGVPNMAQRRAGKQRLTGIRARSKGFYACTCTKTPTLRRTGVRSSLVTRLDRRPVGALACVDGCSALIRNANQLDTAARSRASASDLDLTSRVGVASLKAALGPPLAKGNQRRCDLARRVLVPEKFCLRLLTYANPIDRGKR